MTSISPRGAPPIEKLGTRAKALCARFPIYQDINGGVCGAILGVSSIAKTLPIYREILGYDEIIYDETAAFDDLAFLKVCAL